MGVNGGDYTKDLSFNPESVMLVALYERDFQPKGRCWRVYGQKFAPS